MCVLEWRLIYPISFQISRRKMHCIIYSNHHMKGNIFASPFALAEWPMVPVCCMYSTLFICALKKKLGKFLITRAFNWYSVENWIMLWPNIKENLNVRYSDAVTLTNQIQGLRKSHASISQKAYVSWVWLNIPFMYHKRIVMLQIVVVNDEPVMCTVVIPFCWDHGSCMWAHKK